MSEALTAEMPDSPAEIPQSDPTTPSPTDQPPADLRQLSATTQGFNLFLVGFLILFIELAVIVERTPFSVETLNINFSRFVSCAEFGVTLASA